MFEREVDEDDRREAMRQRRMRRRTFCLCGYPDWPGQCPGPERCPVHGESRATLCPKCGNLDVWGEPGKHCCLTCGAHERS